MQTVSILKQTLDPKYWELQPPRKHYSGHMYRNSPYETDDSCGNCDGARCEVCRLIIDEPDFECGMTCTDFVNAMVEAGIPLEHAENICYSDYSNHSGGYRCTIPHSYQLREKYPEFYQQLIEANKDKLEEYRVKFEEMKEKK